MPRPEIFEKDHTIIKLDNGYNIGIENQKIKKIEVVKKYEKKKEEKHKLSHKEGLPTVSILSFGGTISSRVDYKTGGVYADYTAEDQALWDATLVISGTNVIVQVTGAALNNVTWHCTTKIQNVGT